MKSSSSFLSIIHSSSCFNRRLLNAESFPHTLDTIEILVVTGLIKFSDTTTDWINGIYYIARNVQLSSSDEVLY